MVGVVDNMSNRHFLSGRLVLCTSYICKNYGCCFRKPKKIPALAKQIDWKPFLQCEKFK